MFSPSNDVDVGLRHFIHAQQLSSQNTRRPSKTLGSARTNKLLKQEIGFGYIPSASDNCSDHSECESAAIAQSLLPPPPTRSSSKCYRLGVGPVTKRVQPRVKVVDQSKLSSTESLA